MTLSCRAKGRVKFRIEAVEKILTQSAFLTFRISVAMSFGTPPLEEIGKTIPEDWYPAIDTAEWICNVFIAKKED